MRVASFYVQNFGCRATQADGAAIERQFLERGLEAAATLDQADIVVLNTCTVTAAADQDARAAIRRVQRDNPNSEIVVTGCYAQRAPEEIAALPGVTHVIGNSHKHELASLVTDSPAAKAHSRLGSSAARLKAGSSCSENRSCAEKGPSLVPLSMLTTDDGRGTTSQRPTANDQRLFVSDIFAHTELLAAPVFDAANERTRPNLKVQDGCDNRCSFCIIPYVRGQSRSLPLDNVVREVNTLVAAGYREVVISGINLGRWGRDLVVSRQSSVVSQKGLRQRPATNDQRLGLSQRLWTSAQRLSFVDLVRAILNETGLQKLRISSVEPMDWSDDLIELVASSPRIAKHAHIPMQSASDRVLRAMHRKYRPWHYREKIEKIRSAMPNAAIGADVMVGFPGESAVDFEQTRRVVEELPFTYLHVFTYSSRPGTSAATMSNQVPVHVARERNRTLRELASAKKLAFMRAFIGKTVEAITLNVFDGEYTEALTDNYLKLRISGQLEPNRWLVAVVDQVVNGELLALPGAVPT
ncbi:MAG TPA: MiaB/RimO family radical SAM methylthiotransferase [Terriglobales bacterium]|nr:MiaB/RimO family radical SAM methylthiotransferase [Terriglobales bacterium]